MIKNQMRRSLQILTVLLAPACAIMSCAVAAPGQKPEPAPSVVSETTGNWTEARPGTPRGKVETFSVADKHYQRNRRVWVYTPPNYDRQAKLPYSLLFCFDGLSYTTDIPASTILDNLIAADKITPTIAVMVDNEEARLDDLANHKAFADFMADGLVPWVRQNYRVTTDGAKTTLCGFSAGGLAAAYVAWRHPDLFGNILSQSGAFWRGNEGGSDELEWLTKQFKDSAKLNLRFYLEVGALETGKTAGGPVFIEANQRLHQVLAAKGYEVQYVEVPGARHEAAHWRLQLAGGLIYLSGKQAKP